MTGEPTVIAASGREARAEFDVIAGHLNAQHGRLIDAAIWTLDNELHWSGEGLTAPETFLAWRFAIAVSTAREAVAIARRAEELPECVQAVRDGLLSFDQVASIVKYAPGWADRQVLNLCERLTVSQIRRTLSRYSWPADPDADPGDVDAPDVSAGADESGTDAVDAVSDEQAGAPPIQPVQPIQPSDTVTYGIGPDGRWFMHANLGADIGSIVQQALDERRDHLFHEGVTDVDAVDALLALVESSLDSIVSTARRNRFRTNIFMHADREHAVDNLGRPLPDCIAQHIACDGTIAPIFLENGVPVSVGRSQHIVPDRTRRIVIERDGGCTTPGCNHRGHLEVHHIVHWADGGPTDTWNLICLCPRHHRLHHQGRLGIRGDADAGTVVFTNRHGVRIADCAARPVPPDRPPPRPAGTYRAPLGERLDSNYVSFPHPATLSHEIRRNTRW